MDARHFDSLVRSLSERGPRRGLLGMFATLPLVGGLLAFLDADDVDAKGRRKRRKKRHKHGKGRHKKKHHKKKCKPQSLAKTCADTCGQVKNNCKKTVDCGSCVCDPPCPVCQICDESTGSCVPNAETVGDACDTCHVCDAAGECVAEANGTSCDDGNACTQTDTCQGGVCVGGDPVVCQPLDQCHEAGACNTQSGQCSNPAKPNGSSCDDGNPCTVDDICTAGVCAGTPDPSKEHVCGECPSGQWCDAGECAAIQGTVTIPECQGLCGGDTTVCGQTVTCPSCDFCNPQTGCSGPVVVPNGPVGPGDYCATTAFGGGQPCTTNNDCPSGLYCRDGPPDQCVHICPF